MLKRLVLVLAALGLFLAAMPTRVDAQNYFIRGYINNTSFPFTIDSVYMYYDHGPMDIFITPFFGGHLGLDSHDFRAMYWPTAIKHWIRRPGTPEQLDSFRPVRGQWHVWHYIATWESCLVLYDSMPHEGVEESKPGSTLRLELSGASPNPFAAYTTIGFANPEAQPVELTVYNLVGRPVRTLVAGYAPAGSGRAVWNGADDAGRALESGVYFCRLTASGRTLTEKLILDR